MKDFLTGLLVALGFILTIIFGTWGLIWLCTSLPWPGQ